MSKFLVWFKGFAATVIGGAVAGAAQAAQGSGVTASQVKVAAITGAVLTVAAYFKQAPTQGQ